MTNARLNIGTLAKRTGCTVPTIRYYEAIGLLPAPARAENGHRFYRESDATRLGFIKRCRDFGFPIEQVRAMTALYQDGERACVEVRDLAQVRLDEVRRKLAEMRQLEKSLEAFVSSCDETCNGGPTRGCVIIEDMSRDLGSTRCAGGNAGTVDAPATTGALVHAVIRELKRDRACPAPRRCQDGGPEQ